MNYFITILIAALFLSCNFSTPKNTADHHSEKVITTVDSAKIARIRLTTPSDYRQALDTLDMGDLTSISIAAILFKNCSADTLVRDSIFMVFNDFLNNVAGSYLENNEKVSLQLGDSPTPEMINQLKRNILSYGILLNSSKGSFYLEPQNEFLLQNFGSALSPAYRQYLAISSREQLERFSEEGTILISADSLASRILSWEDFLVRYPRFCSVGLAQDQYAQYMGAFLAGMENSRVFDPQTNLLKDSSKTSFESFISKNPGSRSSEVVRSYLELLAKLNFMYTDKVDSFLLERVFSDEGEVENK